MTLNSGKSESPDSHQVPPGAKSPEKSGNGSQTRPSISLVLLLVAVIAAGAGAGAWAFARPDERTVEFIIPTPGPITVHVTGVVAAPGVYTLPPGSRAQDAIDAAGGLSSSSPVNLAAVLHDGQQLVVTEPPATRTPAETGTVTSPPNRLDLNTASADELEQLPGIGPSRAAAIINFRDRNGLIKYADDLTAIDGIGPATVDAIRPLVVQP
jgi:competence protein ComEA